MSRVLKTSKLIESVRDRAFIPKEDAVYNDQAVIDVLNEQIDTILLPKLMSINEEHLVNSVLVDANASDGRYEIPYRAVGNKLRELAFVDGAGNTYEMSRVSLEELSDYRNGAGLNSHNLFYVEGNEIVIVNAVTNQYPYLKMSFYIRPNSLVKDDLVPAITSIDTVNGLLTLSFFPEAFSDALLFDFIGAKTPNKILSYDKNKVSVNRSAKTIIFAADDIPSKLKIGDYVTVSEETVVPNIPTEYHPVLAQAAAVYILEALGDTEGLQNALRKLDTMEKGVMQLTDDRVEGAPRKINQRHTTLVSSLRGSNSNRRRY